MRKKGFLEWLAQNDSEGVAVLVFISILMTLFGFVSLMAWLVRHGYLLMVSVIPFVIAVVLIGVCYLNYRSREE